MSAPVRVVAVVVALALLTGGAALGYITVIAFRRDEGVYMPAGYVAAFCLAGSVLLLRLALRP